MRRQLETFLGFGALLGVALMACVEGRKRPITSPSAADGTVGGATTISGPSGSSASSGSSGSGSSSGTGAGGGGPSADVVHVLTCADHETHVVDCESCRAGETQGVCTGEWQTCLADNYCGQGFFDCITACAPGNQACENTCYTKQPTSESVITDFVSCVCNDCSQFCS